MKLTCDDELEFEPLYGVKPVTCDTEKLSRTRHARARRRDYDVPVYAQRSAGALSPHHEYPLYTLLANIPPYHGCITAEKQHGDSQGGTHNRTIASSILNVATFIAS